MTVNDPIFKNLKFAPQCLYRTRNLNFIKNPTNTLGCRCSQRTYLNFILQLRSSLTENTVPVHYKTLWVNVVQENCSMFGASMIHQGCINAVTPTKLWKVAYDFFNIIIAVFSLHAHVYQST